MRNLTPQEKKQYLLQKYSKRDYGNIADLDKCKKFAVYFNPSIDKIKEWTLVSVNDSLEEAKKSILWKQQYMNTKDGDLVLDHDPNFFTWRDETKNITEQGLVYEPTDSDMIYPNLSPGADVMNQNLLQVIANSVPQTPQKNGFKGACFYNQFEIGNYQGYYKIEEVYHLL